MGVNSIPKELQVWFHNIFSYNEIFTAHNKYSISFPNSSGIAVHCNEDITIVPTHP